MQAVKDERADHGDGPGEHGDRLRRAPAPVVALDETERQEGHAGGDEGSAERVGVRDALAADVGQPQPADREDGQPEGDVGEEDPAPADRDEEPTHDRSEGRHQTADRRPCADVVVALLARARRQHHAQRRRRHQRRAGGLDDAEDDQCERVVRRSAERRRDGEHGDPEQEPVLPREAIGQAPEDDEQCRVDDRIGVQDPREITQPGRAEVMRDVRQRDVDDEHIQNCEGEADRDDQQDKRRRGVATTSEELTKERHSQVP